MTPLDKVSYDGLQPRAGPQFVTISGAKELDETYELTANVVLLNIGGSLHDPTDPIGRLLFTTLSMIAEFEADLARARTREGMAVARTKGRLRGKQPKLSPKQEAHLVELYRGGGRTIGELEELFSVTRSTIYRAVGRAGDRES